MYIRRMKGHLVGRAAAVFLLLIAPALADESPAELISDFRLMHGEVTVLRDETLELIALEQARAMAAKNELSHEALAHLPAGLRRRERGRAAENIAYGYDGFKQTLSQWIGSSGHRQNLLLHNASRVGIASAKDASGKRTYWTMVIAGDLRSQTARQGAKGALHCYETRCGPRAEYALAQHPPSVRFYMAPYLGGFVWGCACLRIDPHRRNCCSFEVVRLQRAWNSFDSGGPPISCRLTDLPSLPVDSTFRLAPG